MAVDGVYFKIIYISLPEKSLRVISHFVGLGLDEKHSILKIMFLPPLSKRRVQNVINLHLS